MPNISSTAVLNLDHLDPLVAVVVRRRKQQGWSQTKLAETAGISRRALVMIEKGGDCTLSTLRRLHTCLDITLQACSAPRPTLDDMNAENERERFGTPP